MIYDALDRMIEQTRGSSHTEIVYGPYGLKLALMNGQTLVNAFVKLPGGSRAVYGASGLAYYRHSDHLGSSRLATTPSRTKYYDVAYAPYGEDYNGSGTQDLAFTDQNQDTVKGGTSSWTANLYDFMFREYRTAHGRWTSPDPAGLGVVDPTNPQTWNRYAYVLNNPMAMVDLLGDDGCYDASGNQITATISETCGDYGGTWLGGGQWVGSDGNVYGPQYVPAYFAPAGEPGGSDSCTGDCLGTWVRSHWVTVNFGSFQNLNGDVPLPLDFLHNSSQCPNCGNLWSTTNNTMNVVTGVYTVAFGTVMVGAVVAPVLGDATIDAASYLIAHDVPVHELVSAAGNNSVRQVAMKVVGWALKGIFGF